MPRRTVVLPRTAIVVRAALAVAVVASLVPGLAPASAAPPRSVAVPTAVVALHDTGINPYHAAFRDRSARAYRHPSTYLPGYPRSAKALRVTLDRKDYWSAVVADCARVWRHVKPGQLYWVPGTTIVGAITFRTPSEPDCDKPKPPGMLLLDEQGHGTMVASRAAGKQYGACPACRVVAVQSSLSIERKKDLTSGIDWITRNSTWIDAQSNSWGPFVPGWLPTDAVEQVAVASPGLVRAIEASGKAHLSFWASGNGATFRFGGLGHPTPLTPTLTPSVLSVGGHDSGYVTTWPGFPPHVVSDVCRCWAADPRHSSDWKDNGSGTSSATPFAAGGAARILADARALLRDTRTGVRNGVVAAGRRGLVRSGPLADGKLTLAEWRDLVLKTATARPAGQREDGRPCGPLGAPYMEAPVAWSSVPAGFPEYLNIGYGAVDGPSVALAGAVLRGRRALPDRTATDAYFAQDRALRETTYRVWSTG